MSDVLEPYDSAAWIVACEALRPDIHEIDRDATRIWFQFFPLPPAEVTCAIPSWNGQIGKAGRGAA